MQLKVADKEKLKIIATVKTLKKKPIISIAMIAKNANINSGRVRFIVEMLVEENKLKKTVVKSTNERYIRYFYEVVT